MNPLRIVVADDHEIVREGLRTILEQRPGWTVCAAARDGRELVEAVAAEMPDVVVTDLTMPEMNGLDATRELLQFSPKTRVLILSVHRSEDLVRQALAAGACGYVAKADAAHDLVRAVEAISERGHFFSPQVSSFVVSGYLRGGAPTQASAGPLTEREGQALRLLAGGKTNKEIAVAMKISVRTAETYRSRILAKLELHSTVDLVRYAIRNGMVES